MIETISRVIHPGWLTVFLENENDSDDWTVYHRCVDCGVVITGRVFNSNALYEHSARKHKSAVLNLELHLFRSAIQALNTFYGLEILQWPDKDWNGIRRTPK
jgi:hypothetical protein